MGPNKSFFAVTHSVIVVCQRVGFWLSLNFLHPKQCILITFIIFLFLLNQELLIYQSFFFFKYWNNITPHFPQEVERTIVLFQMYEVLGFLNFAYIYYNRSYNVLLFIMQFFEHKWLKLIFDLLFDILFNMFLQFIIFFHHSSVTKNIKLKVIWIKSSEFTVQLILNCFLSFIFDLNISLICESPVIKITINSMLQGKNCVFMFFPSDFFMIGWRVFCFFAAKLLLQLTFSIHQYFFGFLQLLPALMNPIVRE